MQNASAATYQPITASSSVHPGQHSDKPQHSWKTFTSHDRSLVDAVSRHAAQHPGIRKHIEALDGCGNVEVRLTAVENRDFKTSIDRLLDESPHTVKYSVMNETGTSGVYARELPRSGDTSRPGVLGKKVVDVFCTLDAGGLLSQKHFEGLAGHIAKYAEAGKWPPIFAIFDRPAPGISREVMKKLASIPVEELKGLHGKLLYDLGQCGFTHMEGATRQVAPILTLKVASGDTEGTHWALERAAQPGDVLLIDGGNFVQDCKTPTYANVGGMMRKIAMSHGVKGFIVDGFIRDRAEYNSTDGQFFCHAKGAVTPNGPTKLEAGAIHLPIEGDGYAAKSNDICIADGSHVFLVPSENVDAVMRATGNRDIEPAQNRIFRMPHRQETLKSTAATVVENAVAAPNIAESKDNAAPKELIAMLGETPTAELSDAFSTLTPPKTVGIAIHTREDAETSKSAGIALVAGGSENTVRQGIRAADDRTTLVVPTEDPHGVTLNSSLLKSAEEKSVRAVVTGGTVALNGRPGIPVYAANFVDGDRPVEEGAEVLQQPVQIQGVEIRPGDTIVGDEDGVAVVPRGKEEFALRGGHAIQTKEVRTTAAINDGSVAKRDFSSYALYPSSDAANARFIRTYIDWRDAPVLAARGSSGLKISQPEGIRFLAAESVQAGQSTQAALMQALRSNQSQILQAGDVVKGKPKEVLFDAGDPVVVRLKKSSKIPFVSGKQVYVSGVQGENFRELMDAKENKRSVVVDDQGNVKQRENGLKKFLAQIIPRS